MEKTGVLLRVKLSFAGLSVFSPPSGARFARALVTCFHTYRPVVAIRMLNAANASNKYEGQRKFDDILTGSIKAVMEQCQ
jgi:hypothetical protein